LENKSPLNEKAYQLMKNNLMNYEDGTFLSARAFANEIGMSYTPVRDAFTRLQREGLIKKIPNVGFFVVKLNIKEIIDMFQVRECIEPFILENVFSSITDKHIKTLENLIAEQIKALEEKNIRQYVKIDEQFHLVFFDIWDNQYFYNLIKNVREHYLFCSAKIASACSSEGINEHIQILNYIKSNDKKACVHTMKLHIASAVQRMKDGFINANEI